MRFKNFWKRIIPLFITVTIGLITVNIFNFLFVNKTLELNSLNKKVTIQSLTISNKLKTSQKKQIESVTSLWYLPEENFISIYPVRIISESPIQYTELARQNGTEGTVVLRVAFLANGKIGKIAVEKGLPFGLTEQAISATRKVEYEPLKVHGMYKDSVETVIYTFTID